MIIEINEKQAIILKSLLSEEIRYLSEEAIPEAESEADIKGLKNELAECNNLYSKLSK